MRSPHRLKVPIGIPVALHINLHENSNTPVPTGTKIRPKMARDAGWLFPGLRLPFVARKVGLVEDHDQWEFETMKVFFGVLLSRGR
ncbi:hypothetical protein M427DRAFT_468615 [Gonapodya prolifera JEL478]|uniref:Uncharacterized protein n=1 Tax=Gonapodya prolifera (strain JEL478) TaxID=1344416 RepID=A0A139AQN8_GONPJ|nr:hypothetical protein M427DRAFT_468615 [Gonapodya prolifera JEL478]|eukprot:KXS19077.1 hypothetical protein M427DRAFT_468615 [Gonapodya prolifera JEL478]